MGHVPNIMLVTELSRRGAHPCVTLEKYPTVKAGRNRFLFTAFQPWESLEHLSLKPSLPMRPSTFHALHQATSQNTPKSFPCSYRVLIQLHKLFSSPSGRYQSHYPHAAALSFGICDTCSSAPILIVQKAWPVLPWIMVKLRKGTSLKSPCKPWLVQLSALSMGCEPKCCRFDSQSGHMPRLQARSPV